MSYYCGTHSIRTYDRPCPKCVQEYTGEMQFNGIEGMFTQFQQYLQWRDTPGVDTDAEEEAAENLPGDTDNGINWMKNAEYWKAESVRRDLINREYNNKLERDIAAIRQAIGQEHMDRILSGDVQSVGDAENGEIRLTERRSKWVSR